MAKPVIKVSKSLRGGVSKNEVKRVLKNVKYQATKTKMA